MPKSENLTNRRFGKLIVIKQLEEKEDGYYLWLCQCDCGRYISVNTKRLARGTIDNCGCIPKKTARNGTLAEDLTGRRFGRLVVVQRVENKNSRVCWHCKCDCGNEVEVTEDGLCWGSYRSCGCLREEINEKIATRLHFVDRTCVEILEKRKYRKDNTSGFRGSILQIQADIKHV